MSPSIALRLAWKDIHLMRVPLALYTAAALAGLALAAAGSPVARSAGITLALNVLIAVSFHVTLGPVLGERERKTLAFVMSLPVAPRDTAAAKLLASFFLFLVPGSAAAASLVFLSPVNVFASMAADHRSALSHLAGWLAYFALALGAWAVLFSVVLAAAIVSESLGWTIGVLTGLIFVVGNIVLQLAPRVGWVIRYVRDLAHGGPSLGATLAAEAVGIALIVAATFILQDRKTSFV
jgi:hypothetical protein